MRVLSVLAVITVCVFFLIILVFHIRSPRPLRSLLLNAALGIISLVAINLTTRFTGVHIPVNPYSAGGSAVFGIPATVALIILQMLIKE